MDRVGTIAEQAQLSALADDHRRAILRRLICGPSTLSRLGRDFDRHPAWIRHHLKRLEAVGLVEPAGERTTRNYTEKFYRASAGAYTVNMLIGPDTGAAHLVMVLGSDDFALELLASEASAAGAAQVIPAAIGSLDGLIALRQGLADVAGCHLFDTDTADFNIPYLKHLFPDRAMAATTLAHREQGLMVAPGNPLGLHRIEDLLRPGIRLANRNEGSGTRVWLDRRLRDLGADTADIVGYDEPLGTHTDVALAVASGKSDVGLGIQAAAERFELTFVPLFLERYDLVVDASRIDDPDLAPLLDRLCSKGFRAEVRAMRGYDSGHTGEGVRVSR